MTAKNNHTEVAQRLPHYGLRKLSIGVASVLLSTTFYLGVSEANGLADSNVSTEQEVTVSHSSQPSSNLQKQTVTLNNNGNQKSAALDSDSNESVMLASSEAQQSDPSTTNGVPKATNSIDNQVSTGNGQIKVDADTKVTQTDASVVGQPGTTNLNLKMTIPASVLKSLKSGDYIDIQLGLPYKDKDGHEYVMSYGAVNGDAAPIVLKYNNMAVGYIVATGDDLTGYRQTVGQNGQLQVTDNKNKSDDSLGTSNGYYRIIFNDNLKNYLQNHPGEARDWGFTANLKWYNGLSDPHKMMTSPAKNIKLYTQGQAGTYTPNDDLKIGNETKSSGLSFQVIHVAPNEQAFNLTNTNVPSNHTSAYPAQSWFEKDGKSYLRDTDDNTQGVGLTLTTQDKSGHQLGKEFTITVTKPAGKEGILNTNFVGADDVAKQLQNIIDPEQTNSALADPLTNGNYYFSDQPLYQAPKVTVTMETSNGGNTATYHVKIDGNYKGFKSTFKDGNDQLSPITLIQWKPADKYGLLPPNNIKSFEDESGKNFGKSGGTYQSNSNYFSGYPIRNNDIKNYLKDKPWKVNVSNNSGFTYSNTWGYWIDANNQAKPENGAFVGGEFYGWVNQRIHFIDENGNQMKDNNGNPTGRCIAKPAIR